MQKPFQVELHRLRLADIQDRRVGCLLAADSRTGGTAPSGGRKSGPMDGCAAYMDMHVSLQEEDTMLQSTSCVP
ncbi:MAG: hypothetical protein O6945_01330 [Gammaproteobacteria bacterium]|nr:hypothetical protein [Gammaproteobacteria bacterium]